MGRSRGEVLGRQREDTRAQGDAQKGEDMMIDGNEI
jgi:hypothetical protein